MITITMKIYENDSYVLMFNHMVCAIFIWNIFYIDTVHTVGIQPRSTWYHYTHKSEHGGCV